MDSKLRYVAFQNVGSDDGTPVYSVVDIIEPGSTKYQGSLLRRARKIAGQDGYVMVGLAGLEWPEFNATARRVEGL